MTINVTTPFPCPLVEVSVRLAGAKRVEDHSQVLFTSYARGCKSFRVAGYFDVKRDDTVVDELRNDRRHDVIFELHGDAKHCLVACDLADLELIDRTV